MSAPSILLATEVDATTAANLIEQLNTRLKLDLQEIEKKNAELQKKRDTFEAEKQDMLSKPVKEGDVLKLNVGGKLMSTNRRTLISIPDSHLASMFNGRWDDKLELDDKKRVFLDLNPDCFSLIVNYLRSKMLDTDDNVTPFPVIEPEMQLEFETIGMCKLLGLWEN